MKGHPTVMWVLYKNNSPLKIHVLDLFSHGKFNLLQNMFTLCPKIASIRPCHSFIHIRLKWLQYWPVLTLIVVG